MVEGRGVIEWTGNQGELKLLDGRKKAKGNQYPYLLLLCKNGVSLHLLRANNWHKLKVDFLEH